MTSERIAVIGLGYVGLPVALAFARRFPGTIGFDIDPARIAALREGHDVTGEVEAADLADSGLAVTADPADLSGVNFFIATVPTPIDSERRPDFGPLLRACGTIGGALTPGAVVVFESTVYPGATEEVCGPALARASGLRAGIDFALAYSPERINPGDREHRLERIVKVVSGQDDATLERVAAAYGAIIPAGLHRAPSIRVAEAAKVIENTQRDLNIALMNELAMIFDRLGLRTAEVLAAAGTKWNFLKFQPGLVGGHCIGVDPYYLTAKAEAVGYRPEMILAGRRINDQMGAFLGARLVKVLARQGRTILGARVGILGLTFKENVSDLRNSRVPDIVAELKTYGIAPLVHDPLADPERARQEYGIDLAGLDAFRDLDALVLAVPHRAYLDRPRDELWAFLREGGLVMDVKSALDPASVPSRLAYWSL
ncbi:nucleotide sugar dehydrogenase [Inquilinus sp. YAF38]|uniref:nucleotide sugar dehydrogenase n=1 Tax=Inquilinus sp. YAF38 TaxID=3233084 RepID=UPI003F8EF069